MRPDRVRQLARSAPGCGLDGLLAWWLPESVGYVGDRGLEGDSPFRVGEPAVGAVRDLAGGDVQAGASDSGAVPAVTGGSPEEQDDLEAREHPDERPGPADTAATFTGGGASVGGGDREWHHVPVHDVRPAHRTWCRNRPRVLGIAADVVGESCCVAELMGRYVMGDRWLLVRRRRWSATPARVSVTDVVVDVRVVSPINVGRLVTGPPPTEISPLTAIENRHDRVTPRR